MWVNLTVKTVKGGKQMKKLLLSLVLSLMLVVGLVSPVLAATDADVDITATPAYIAISDNASSYDFGVVATSSTPTTDTSYVAITNTSTVQTDITISVTAASWAGGVTWTHSDTATPGADTAGLESNRGGTWESGDIIVKNAAPNYIYENCPALTDFDYGLQLIAPTSFGDGVQKSITVRVSAVAG